MQISVRVYRFWLEYAVKSTVAYLLSNTRKQNTRSEIVKNLTNDIQYIEVGCCSNHWFRKLGYIKAAIIFIICYHVYSYSLLQIQILRLPPSINQPMFARKIDASLCHQNTHIISNLVQSF